MAKRVRELPAPPADFRTDLDGGTPGVEALGRLAAMIKLAEGGDEQAGKAVLEACRTVPRLWEMLSILSGQAERAWVDLVVAATPHDQVARAVVEQDLRRKRREVAGEGATPLEELLAQRVALCWVAASFADEQYANKVRQGMSFKEGEYYARRCEQANRNLLRSAEALARVRRLLTPAIQLNVADKQVNVAR